jgi:hypothetical protein
MQNLGATIRDYTVFVRYEDAGITDEFETFMQEKMHGTYLQDNVIQNLCSRITPSDLADWALARNYQMIASTSGISLEWAQRIVGAHLLLEYSFRSTSIGKTAETYHHGAYQDDTDKRNPGSSTVRWPAPHYSPDHRDVSGIECAIGDRAT